MASHDQVSNDESINREKSTEEKKKPRKAMRFIKPKFFFYGFLTGCISLIIAATVFFFQGMLNVDPSPEPEIVNETYVRESLSPAAELTTAKYIFSGIMDYDNKKIPIINRSKFSMFYSATVRIGIEDLSETVIEVDDETVTVILPASTITEVTIHPSSLRFFDEKDSIMSNHTRDEVKEALEAAEKNAREVDMDECLDVADENAASIVRDFLERMDLGDREIVIQRMPRKSSTAETAHIGSENY